MRTTVAAMLLLSVGACSGSDIDQLATAIVENVGKAKIGKGSFKLVKPETPAERAARARDFARRADTLVATDARAGTGLVATTACAQARCLWTDASGEAFPPRTISDLFPTNISDIDFGFVVIDGRVDFTYNAGSGGRKTYGYWMTHSVFGVAEEVGWIEGAAMARFGFAGGDLTGSRPSADATWSGAMVGSAGGTRLGGDATLTWSAVEPEFVDVAFSNIRDRNGTGNPWSVHRVRFDDIPLDVSGTFRSGASGNLIRGGFHGPDHAEAVGAFERHGIVGSFGTARRE